MIHDVDSACYQGEYKIEVTFDGGKRGVVDFSKYLIKGGPRAFQGYQFLPEFLCDPRARNTYLAT